MLVETTGKICLHGEYPVLQIRIPEPVPFWPWIRRRFFPDPGSQTHIFDSLMTDFRVNSTIILSALAKQNFLYQFKNKIIHNFMIFVATEMGRTSATLRVPLPSLVYHSVFIILFFFLFLASWSRISLKKQIEIPVQYYFNRYCSARDWEWSGLLEENPQSGCTEIRASLKGPL